jgi:hypothetical protein
VLVKQVVMGEQIATPRPRQLLDQVRGSLCVKHRLSRVEQAYINWVMRCILYHTERVCGLLFLFLLRLELPFFPVRCIICASLVCESTHPLTLVIKPREKSVQRK